MVRLLKWWRVRSRRAGSHALARAQIPMPSGVWLPYAGARKPSPALLAEVAAVRATYRRSR